MNYALRASEGSCGFGDRRWDYRKTFGRKKEVLSCVPLWVNCAEPVQWHPPPVPVLLGQSEGEWVWAKVMEDLPLLVCSASKQWECQWSSQILWQVFYSEFEEPVPRQLTAAGFVSRNTVVPRMEMVISVGVANVD